MNTTALRKKLKDSFANGSMSSNRSDEGDILATLRYTRLPKRLSAEVSATSTT